MSNSGNQQNRRSFCKLAVISAASLLLMPLTGRKGLGNLAFADATFKLLSENDPVAKSLGYHGDAKKVDVKKWPKRAGAEGKDQFCHNCMFYTAANKKEGKCQIFPNNLVAANGWCNTWSKKPA